jgi:hypothetical protein
VLAGALALYAVAFLLASTSYSRQLFGLHNGREIFRFDTFGDEQLWTDTLQLHTAVQGLTPAAALGAGLKVDSRALPREVIRAIEQGQVNLNDPAVTAQLLSLDAVLGVKARVSAAGTIESIGITCALCHSVVDNSVTTGIGRRLDGWPNRDLNVGAIVAMSPVLTAAQRAIFNSWGPGKFDPRLQAFNGESFISLNSTTFPVMIPPAYGLRGVEFETFTGDGPISYWNNYVGVSQMGGHGSFSDPRIPLSIEQEPDLVTPQLRALLRYQLSLNAPNPPRGSFDRFAARRGQLLFRTVARCAECHTGRVFTDVGDGPNPILHAPSETGMEPEYASRSTTGMYRTSPLRGVWQHPPYFHDGSAATLEAVVEHYNGVLNLQLTDRQKNDLVEYLKSL